MRRVDGVLGNVRDDDRLAQRRRSHAEAGTLERVVIPAERRRRSRFRTTTDGGTDVGVVLDRPALSPGDVLLLETDLMVVVAFEPVDALALELPASSDLEAAVELGHRVGNQHWDLAIREGVVYVPLEADRHIVERVVTDAVPDVAIRETTVDAELFAAGPGEHAHGDDHEHPHAHSHGDGHAHTHSPDHERGGRGGNDRDRSSEEP